MRHGIDSSPAGEPADRAKAPSIVSDMAVLLARARALAASTGRSILGIAGAPGSGKSTLARRIAGELGEAARLVPMDGFHLAGAELHRLGRQDRKGAVDTFDAAGYAALLRRLRDPVDEVVYAPEFRREIEEPIAGAIAVTRDVRLIVTEGNYLLVADGPWGGIRGLLDETWFVEPDDGTRVERLVARHVAHGRAPDAARAWTLGTDQRNADLVALTRERADVLVHLDET
jgi:pantothenate kinase